MCQILHHQHNANPVSLNVFYELAHSNPDGIGLTYKRHKSAHLTVFKTLNYVKDAWLRYYNAAKAGHEVIVHWRFTTHGDTSLANCHPFPLPNGGVLFHNGMLPIVPVSKSKSDTRMLALDCMRWGLDPFDADLSKANAAQRILTASSEGSRLMAMSVDGEIWRCGVWVDDETKGYSWANHGCSIAPMHKYPSVYNSRIKYSGQAHGWSEDDEYDARWHGLRAKMTSDDKNDDTKPRLLVPISGGLTQPTQYPTGANLYHITESPDVPEYPMVLCEDCLRDMVRRAGLVGIVLATLNEALDYGKSYEKSGTEVVCEFCWTADYGYGARDTDRAPILEEN